MSSNNGHPQGIAGDAAVLEQGKVVFARPAALSDNYTHYCPGCTHGLIHRLIAEAIDELGIRERVIAVAPVGCSVLLYQYFDVDAVEAAHGRAPAMATGLKRTQPDKVVFTYQGDGDLASIGAAEILRGQPWREYQRFLHQQCRLRHDQRPDGPYDLARPDHDIIPDGPQRGAPRLPHAHGRDRGRPAGRLLCGPPLRP